MAMQAPDKPEQKQYTDAMREIAHIQPDAAQEWMAKRNSGELKGSALEEHTKNRVYSTPQVERVMKEMSVASEGRGIGSDPEKRAAAQKRYEVAQSELIGSTIPKRVSQAYESYTPEAVAEQKVRLLQYNKEIDRLNDQINDQQVGLDDLKKKSPEDLRLTPAGYQETFRAVADDLERSKYLLGRAKHFRDDLQEMIDRGHRL